MKRQSRRSHERGMSPCVRYSRPGRHWHEIRADIVAQLTGGDIGARDGCAGEGAARGPWVEQEPTKAKEGK